jgi:hypothetical protein
MNTKTMTQFLLFFGALDVGAGLAYLANNRIGYFVYYMLLAAAMLAFRHLLLRKEKVV